MALISWFEQKEKGKYSIAIEIDTNEEHFHLIHGIIDVSHQLLSLLIGYQATKSGTALVDKQYALSFLDYMRDNILWERWNSEIKRI